MSQSLIEALLRAEIGLSAELIGAQSIASAIRNRMSARGITDPADFHYRLQNDPLELAEMIEEVIVPESWFFRGVEAFRNLSRYLSQWRPANTGKVFRALSIPCANGEEPYSIAMILLSSGLEPHQFHIDAVDISRRVLQRAEQAAYGEFSFRESEVEFQMLRDRYFEKREAAYCLRDSVKSTVAFQQGNLVHPLFLSGQPAYDVIFCRNLFIYLDETARRIAISALHRLLVRGGVLYMGHAEPISTWDPRFRVISHPHAFAFRHADSVPATGTASIPRPFSSPTTRPATSLARIFQDAVGSKQPPGTRQAVPKAASKAPATQNKNLLEVASQAANAGRFADGPVGPKPLIEQ